MQKKIFILGGGGFGREILNIFTDLNRENEVEGYIEENCQREGELINGKPIYDISLLEDLDKDDLRLVGAIGTPHRKNLIKKTKKMGCKFETVIHPNVIISKWVEMGEGCIICAGNILTNQIKLGKHVILNLGCTIGHDVNIGDYTTLSPGVRVNGNLSIGKSCFFGAGVITSNNLSVGNNVFIGAGSLISKKIPNNVFALGTPARPIKKLKESDWINFPNISL